MHVFAGIALLAFAAGVVLLVGLAILIALSTMGPVTRRVCTAPLLSPAKRTRAGQTVSPTAPHDLIDRTHKFSIVGKRRTVHVTAAVRFGLAAARAVA